MAPIGRVAGVPGPWLRRCGAQAVRGSGGAGDPAELAASADEHHAHEHQLHPGEDREHEDGGPGHEEDHRAEGLRVCMDKLSDRHRRVLDLKYGRRQSTKTIAEQVGGSPGSVDTMVYRIREALRQCINQYMKNN